MSHHPTIRMFTPILALILSGLVAASAWAATAVTRRMSVSSNGTQGNGDSHGPDISNDGRYVAFASGASNLVDNDTNATVDVFVRDRSAATTTRMSVSSTGVEGNNESVHAAISANGRFVAFTSIASNLVDNDTNAKIDVFVRDRAAGTTTRVSVSSTGVEGNSHSQDPAISANGRFIAFESEASNLVDNDTNGPGLNDVFLRDLVAKTTNRVSVSSTGVEGNGVSLDPAISANGSLIAFTSGASNLVGNDTNGAPDSFVRDLVAKTTRRVSVSATGAQGNGGSHDPAISADGRFVAFTSEASNLVGNDTNATVDVFVRDRGNAGTRRVSVSSTGVEGNGPSYGPDISPNGRLVVFNSDTSNLVGDDTNERTDIFVRDRGNAITTRVSVSSTGAESNGSSNQPSTNDRFAVFFSDATNLVPNDTNLSTDVFLRGPLI